MERDTTRRDSRPLPQAFTAAWMLLLAMALPAVVHAGGHDDYFWPDDRKPRTQIGHEVESRSDGVYIRIWVHQTTPGTDGSELWSGSRSQQTGTQGGSSSGSSTASPPSASVDTGRDAGSVARPGRSWSDVTGYHYEAPGGQVVTLTPPLISTATRESWMTQLQQHEDDAPYLLYMDDEFGGVIWVPRAPDNNSFNMEFVQADNPPEDTLPSGNGASTDPREVALDALGHLPLPNIQLRANPGLGLVSMPGWFWVEGYDGSAFGTSRTVDIPPEVGADVPVDVVPADDPRREGSSFTVEVRVWPTDYDWSFGDGASLSTRSLGKPYPMQSDIQHVYEFSSLPFPEGFPVRLVVEFAAEYRVNGGEPQGLPSIRRSYEIGYRVQEVQSVLGAG